MTHKAPSACVLLTLMFSIAMSDTQTNDSEQCPVTTTQLDQVVLCQESNDTSPFQNNELVTVCRMSEANHTKTACSASNKTPYPLNDITAPRHKSDVSLVSSHVWGPGLRSDFQVTVRYFYVQLVDIDGRNFTQSLGTDLIQVSVSPLSNSDDAWVRSDVIDRRDGSYVIIYRPYDSMAGVNVSLTLGGSHLAGSPYVIRGPVIGESCDCPTDSSEEWAESVGCPASYSQIQEDFRLYDVIDMKQTIIEAKERYNMPEAYSWCHYKIVDNKVYRKCYGEHVGFNKYSDAIILSLTRKMLLPDLEFLLNLGDWPLDVRDIYPTPLPMISWCGSTESGDIVIPTYDITDSTLELMDSAGIDMLSLQGESGPPWANKTSRAFWRGRDSSEERLTLAEMSRAHPQLIDAKLTHMFFFEENAKKYGNLSERVPIPDFFKYKYQINLDGTVAAYRLPFLLAGDSLVFKQDSEYYENFYSDLDPYVHYVPVKRDLSDLQDRLQWAKDNDEKAEEIAKNGQIFVRENLNPDDILCYHVRVFQEYAARLKDKPQASTDFDLVPQSEDSGSCMCSHR